MTVCVAAICDNNMIVGASDRMMTAWNTEFQPPKSKTNRLTGSIAIMVAGDALVQTEVLQSLRQHIKRQSQLPPGSQPNFNVENVAKWYSCFYRETKSRQAENRLLAPLGLTQESFLSRQHSLNVEFIDRVTTSLLSYSLPSTAAIVAGIDESGPHLYGIEDGHAYCCDNAGFAAVGAGVAHASSCFISARHVGGDSLSRTALLTYAAKKRAEAAPGVGSETDMFIIGPGLETYTDAPQNIVDDIHRIYNESVEGHAKADLKAERDADEYVRKLRGKESTKTD